MNRARKQFAAWATGLAVVAALTGTVLATVTFTDPTTGITVTYPGVANSVFYNCEPWESDDLKSFTVGNIPTNSTLVVRLTTFKGDIILSTTQQTFSGVTGSFTYAFPYPQDTEAWPIFDEATNERVIGYAGVIDVKNAAGATIARLRVPKFSVHCRPPQRPREGCTPGYWRQFGADQGGDQHLHSWVAAGLSPSDDFETVFQVDATFNPHTLGDAVWLNGGGENALARHAVAALLNARLINYAYLESQVISMVQAIYATAPNSNDEWNAVKDLFDTANNAGCPLN